MHAFSMRADMLVTLGMHVPCKRVQYRRVGIDSRLRGSSQFSIERWTESGIWKRQDKSRVGSYGSESDTELTPDWLKVLHETAAYDEDVAELLRSTGGSPDALQARMRGEMDALHARITGKSGSGEDALPEVVFRSSDSFDLWFWMELYSPPAEAEIEMLQEVVNSWYMLGRLGAFNSGNLQVLYSPSGMKDDMEYESEGVDGDVLPSSLHDMSPLESNGSSVRFWVDMGTSDELAIDILLNALISFSKEHVGIRRITVGGENEDWETPVRDESPEVTMDPLRYM